MNPFDVVVTRLYNQRVEGRQGTLYSGPIDCLIKTFKAEGLRGLYKVRFASSQESF
jgi:solute carrier family 25 protein 34/35